MLPRLRHLALLTTLSLSSCSLGTQYTPGTVTTASISSHVKLPKRMTFQTPASSMVAIAGAGMGSFAGGMGVGLASGMAARSDAEMREWYCREVIKVLGEEISARRQLQLVPEGQGQATVEIGTALWGFILRGMEGTFNGQCVAVTPLTVKMKDTQGRVLWETYGPHFGSPRRADIPAYAGSELQQNPALMQRALSAALRPIAREIASTLPMGAVTVPGTR